MELLSVLEKLSVLNQDNGKRFTNADRLNVIASLLWNSEYRRINADGLFHLYAKAPAESFRGREAVIVSSHVDCERSITRCFSRSEGNGMLRGTYDNAITNASILYLMLQGDLPDHVLVAFTGDEEEDFKGAKNLVRFLQEQNIGIRHIFVLDVTDMGWNRSQNESADFTIENDFWSEEYGKKITDTVLKLPYRWVFVPGDIYSIPDFIPSENVIHIESAEDEAWYYDEKDIDCCSVCLPIFGEMHSDAGVLAWKSAFRNYTDALIHILNLSK